MDFLKWQEMPAGASHVARWTCTGQEPARRAHHHDFAEVFWIEAGTCRHEINGTTETLVAGDLTWIRPRDRHRIVAGVAGHPYRFVNLALPWSAARDLAARYARAAVVWDEERLLPLCQRLPGPRIDELAVTIRDLAGDRSDPLARDRVLLGLFADTEAAIASADAAEPAWLRQALAVLDDADGLRDGLPAVVAASGRSVAHCNRSLRRLYGCTTTALVTRRRLEEAARRLSLTDDRVLDIALDVGFEHLGHFHASFRRRYDCTPRAYRQAQRRPHQ